MKYTIVTLILLLAAVPAFGTGIIIYTFDDVTDVEGALITLTATDGSIGEFVSDNDDPEANPLETNLVEDGGDLLGDFNDDGIVNGSDLSFLLGHWGLEMAIYDLDGSGVVDGADLTILLGSWGACPE